MRHALAAVAAALCGLVAQAGDAVVTGQVLDAARKPLAGAHVCYLAGMEEKDCVSADAEGRFSLGLEPYDRVRVVAEGHLPHVFLTASPPASPIVLERTPVLVARLIDARSGRALRGQVTVLFPTGASKGPFPANEVGVRISRVLEPGTVRVTGVAHGYRESLPREVTLVGGREATLVIELEPSEGSGAR
jgi:hypothetical protein